MSETTIEQFALDLDEVPFELLDRKTNTVTKYVIVELPGSLRDDHMETMRSKMELKDGKVSGIKSFKGINTSLLARCIYKIEDDGTRVLVTEKVIQTWPAKTLDRLHEIASSVSGLDKEDKEDEKSKND